MQLVASPSAPAANSSDYPAPDSAVVSDTTAAPANDCAATSSRRVVDVNMLVGRVVGHVMSKQLGGPTTDVQLTMAPGRHRLAVANCLQKSGLPTAARTDQRRHLATTNLKSGPRQSSLDLRVDRQIESRNRRDRHQDAFGRIQLPSERPDLEDGPVRKFCDQDTSAVDEHIGTITRMIDDPNGLRFAADQRDMLLL